ncbi:MAG: peptidoglycan-binding protein [Oscillospiraceae bacterium]|nr:peptidoglycan-binding protein [Oscillospiraceae bacterium]
MGIGFLTVQTRSGEDNLPVRARVEIRNRDGDLLYITETNENGNTEKFRLTAPDSELTLEPGYNRPAYSVVDVHVFADGYKPVHIRDVEIVDKITAVLPVKMLPLEDNDSGPDIEYNIPPPSLLEPTPRIQPGPAPGHFPGTLLRVGSHGEDVRHVQRRLNDIRTDHPSIPHLAEDGIFVFITQSAVIVFQRISGIKPDGIVGPLTWGALFK